MSFCSSLTLLNGDELLERVCRFYLIRPLRYRNASSEPLSRETHPVGA